MDQEPEDIQQIHQSGLYHALIYAVEVPGGHEGWYEAARTDLLERQATHQSHQYGTGQSFATPAQAIGAATALFLANVKGATIEEH